ncbi:MAG TPA: homocitrate synthase [Polyangia bacterium]|jgi:hypothetical protein
MPISDAARARARDHLAAAQRKLDRLAEIDPYFIDLSLRENPFGSRLGQTLEDKVAILPLMREFGFTNILLGTLDYDYPDELEVDDLFMMYLRDHQIDMTGGFAFTDIGGVTPDGFIPSRSMVKLKDYRVPNTLHEVYLSKENIKPRVYDDLPTSIQWLNDNIVGDRGKKPRIIINIVDGCDAFHDNEEVVYDVLTMLAGQPIEGVSFEDDRGTFPPFLVGSYVAAARELLPTPKKLLVHMHSGGGFENASVLEALANGADGVWGGLPKRAAIIGHASLGELIATLVRVGNANMKKYQLAQLLPLATRLQHTDDLEPLPEDLPILGANAYRVTLDFFRQKAGRFMDLPAEAIGGKLGYRVGPLANDPVVLAGRLSEVTGRKPDSFPKEILLRMIALIREDLRQSRRIVYDDPAQLIDLYHRAGGKP